MEYQEPVEEQVEELKEELEEESELEVIHKDYCIHLDSFDEQHRSFRTFASTRLCSLSHDAKSKKSDAGLLNTFKQCCSKQDEFYPPNIPIREMIFRILLAGGNQPQNLEQLKDKLQYQLSSGNNPRYITIEKLERIVEKDRYYCFGPVPETE